MAPMPPRPGPASAIATAAVAILTPIVLIAVSIAPFLTPAWVAFAQRRAEASLWTGFPEPMLRRVTDAILHDLVLGPPRFAVAVGGVQVLEAREIRHMQDVRVVFTEFYLVAAVAAVVLVLIAALVRPRVAVWRGLAIGGGATAVLMVVAGAVVAFAFDAAFEVFHRIFFPVGSYTFDPRTERLVQLFPDRFWSETSTAVGVVVLVLAIVLAWIARRRLAGAMGDGRAAVPIQAREGTEPDEASGAEARAPRALP